MSWKRMLLALRGAFREAALMFQGYRIFPARW